MQVVPVKLVSDSNTLSTFGILDDCIQTTLIRGDIADKLSLVGTPSILPLGTVVAKAKDRVLPEVTLDVMSTDGSSRFFIDEAFVLPPEMFNMAAQPCPPERSDIYTHLDGIELPGPVSADQITILIGANVPKAHVQRQVREGPCNLLAFETPFGWTLFGTAPARRSKHTMCTTTSSSIHPMVEKLWEPHKKVFCNLLHRPRDPLEDTLVKF